MRYWQQDSDTAILKFYGSISTWYNNANDFTNTIDEIQAKYKNLIIRTHCYGGSVFEGSVMYNALAASSLHVTIRIEGIAASMMSIVMLAGDVIEIAENGFVMVHCPTAGCDGNSKQFFEVGKLLKTMEKNFSNAYQKRSGGKTDVIATWFDGADHWFGSEEAKQLRLVDKISDAVVTDSEDNYKPDASIPVEKIFNRFAALLTDDSIPENQDKPKISNMKKDLIAKYGLKGVTEASSDTAVMEALNAHFAELERQASTQKALLISNAIASIEKAAGRELTALEKSNLKTVGETSGVEVLSSFGAMIVPAAATTTTTTTGAANVTVADVSKLLTPELKTLQEGAAVASTDPERAKWSWNDWQVKDPDALEAMATSNYEAFNKLYKAEYKVDAPK